MTNASAPTLRDRTGAFWARHRTLFLMAHSVWALSTGIAVLILARDRYSFVPWVVGCLGLTWASTLFFGASARKAWDEQASERLQKETTESDNDEMAPRPTNADGAPGTRRPNNLAATPSLRHEVTSYFTRGLYQDTLFFLLPFYTYSTVFESPNLVFLVLLGGLALLSCLDVLFDRWLRTRIVFSLVFFATITFAAVNLLLPMLVGISPRLGTPLAAVISVGSAIPLVFSGAHRSRAARFKLALAAGVILVIAVAFPSLVPPVPLRMTSAVFASDIDRETLTLADTIRSEVPMSVVEDRLVVLVQVFSPATIPTTVRLEWRRDGKSIRTTRDLEIVAHENNFRVWDALSRNGTPVEPGRYDVVLRTADGRWFGKTGIDVAPR